MDTYSAIEAMGALANTHRMNLFRLLVRQGPDGLAAGELAQTVGISPSSLSFHIAQLERAGLVTATRSSRKIIYAVDVTGMRSLLMFLTEDCCDGRPEICGDLSAIFSDVNMEKPHSM